MRQFLLLFFAAALAGTAGAGDTPVSPIAPKVADPVAIAAAVQELGGINGIALACGQKEVVARAKTLMIMRVPKTREYGEIFEKATNDGFLAQSAGKASCPSRASVAARLETAARPLPAAPSHQAITETAAPAVGVNPRYLLQDTQGRAFMDSDFRGRFQLITFGYTFCPDICPTTLIEMAEVLKLLGADAARLQPIFVSVDPERDTLDVLRSYTGFFDQRILGATASPELVRRAADNFKVRYEKVQETGAAPLQYAVDHSAGMYLLGPGGEFITKFSYATPVADVATRIRAPMAQAPTTPAGN
ncbi:MAG: SCO family protein [Rhodocyclaceae bacterium]|nr:SCO family protein [Rhodocyclaceae bacterium]